MNMDEPNVREQHNLLVQMYRDQEELSSRESSVLRDPIVHEHVIILNRERLDMRDGCRIDSFVKLECGELMRIGRFVHIASFAHIGIGGGKTIIGDYAAIASGAKIISGSNIDTGLSLSAAAPAFMQVVSRGTVMIGDYACIFAGAIVTPNIRVGEGAILACGAVAVCDIPAWEVWAGVPAKKIRTREVRYANRNR